MKSYTCRPVRQWASPAAETLQGTTHTMPPMTTRLAKLRGSMFSKQHRKALIIRIHQEAQRFQALYNQAGRPLRPLSRHPQQYQRCLNSRIPINSSRTRLALLLRILLTTTLDQALREWTSQNTHHFSIHQRTTSSSLRQATDIQVPNPIRATWHFHLWA